MPDDLSSLPHASLFQMREKSTDPVFQQAIAPAEHQAFAREYAAESPFKAIGLLAAIPAYQLAKALGLGSRTGVSQPMQQMSAGYTGLGQGWAKALAGAFGAQPASTATATPSSPTAASVAPPGMGFGAIKKAETPLIVPQTFV